MDNKPDIRTASLEDIKNFLTENKEKAFRAKQIWQWLWQKGVTSFDEMTNLSQSTRSLLEQGWTLHTAQRITTQQATDGTTKNAWQLADGHIIESVLIPGNERHTVCISSQVGCQMGCKFCATGTLGFKRNLTVAEIVDQVFAAKRDAEALGSSLSNIVLMGMGEPLLNYDNVMKAIDHITSPEELAMSPYRITLSTCGLPDKIKKMADEGVRFNLAISLHSARNVARSSIMPVNKAFNLEDLAVSLKYFVQKTGTRPTFEYLLLKGVNDSIEDAQILAQYCRQFPVKINIIEYNAVEGMDFQQSPDRNRDAFVQFLESKNMIVNVRRSKGKDIDAACGQLANKNKKQ
ncbi:MAG: 23S rRNA (adenine(2503)-C(2))-methyltransferase RlmN [Marinifilaceae bacterium]